MPTDLKCGFCGGPPVETKADVCQNCKKIFQRRMGVPPTEGKIAFVKASLLEMSDMRQFPKNEKAIDRIARVVATFADTEPRWHSRLGGIIVPFQWMMDRICAECEFFPTPIKMRSLYSVYFTPLDAGEYGFFREQVPE